MSSLTNINNNSRVVNVGRTTPVAPGQQPAAKSIPVVLASDQTAVPVEEQNKVQSEVSLSLLGIPRSEVALGIFADVNTYDVNPSEWSSAPQYYNVGYGIKHLPNEAGALVEAPRNKKAVLTSKRFFRYQPGRVSAATFGIKSTVSTVDFARNPAIRKYGIFDNFDGYYWENKQSGVGDNFSVVRRTQSLLKFPTSQFGLTSENLRKAAGNNQDTALPFNQTDDYRVIGKEGRALKGSLFERERKILLDASTQIAEEAFDWMVANNNDFADYYNINGNNAFAESLSTEYAQFRFKEKCHRDVLFAIEMICYDLEWGGDAHTRINTKNYYSGLFSTTDGGNIARAQREKDLHNRAKVIVGNTMASYVAADAKIATLYDILLAFFTDINSNGTNPDIAYRNITDSGSGITYGSKGVIDTLFDTRKHYWSYFVATFEYDANNIHSTSAGQYYEFRGISNWLPEGYNTQLVGKQISPVAFPYNSGDTVDGVVLTAVDALAVNEFLYNIKYKCSRDLEYVAIGYKNDIVGGGNAETLYNASMYYQSGGQSIFTQVEETGPNAGLPTEIDKHKHLRDIIQEDIEDTFIGGIGGRTNTSNRVGTLAQIVIENFSTETTAGVELGKRGFAGNLACFRDGLLMVHAGVNDPNLLKDIEKIKTYTSLPFDNSQPTIFKLTKGNVTYGQKVRLYTQDGANLPEETWTSTRGPTAGLSTTSSQQTSGEIYTVNRVYGPRGDEFSLLNKEGNAVYTAFNSGGGVIIDGTYRNSSDQNSATDGWVYIETVVPFITEEAYDPEYYRNSDRADGTITSSSGVSSTVTFADASEDPFPVGMQWPLRYSSTVQLDDTEALYLGHIDTTLVPTNAQDITQIRQQYDNINFVPEYINWIKNNVKPEFWGVYEYRVPRSRFSHDKLDGQTSKRVYSDVATGPTGIVRPGMEVLDDDGIWVDATSEYDFDFTKVTMLKIEFSWYGAVGALFLAYVPISNGEARWVRVHHLRASNQLKIASLGNATLPITYNTWGGGDELTFGDDEASSASYGYGSGSHHIVKYGASYYIDGGDRGTVRLYSHNNDDTVPAHGKKWGWSDTISNAELDVPAVDGSGANTAPLPYYMGATVRTASATDTGIKVVWADEANNKLILNRQPTSTNFQYLIPDRANVVYGLETKDVILSTIEGNAVRNRVQVYPTKMSTANLGDTPVRLRMKRTPIYQTLVEPYGQLFFTDDYTITSENLPLPVADEYATDPTNPGPVLQNGDEIYGWIQAIIGDVDEETVFGRLYKEANEYYFELLQSFSESVVLRGDGANNFYFLPDGRYGHLDHGEVIDFQYNETKVNVPLADTLSSVEVINNSVVPIPGTGTNVATLYLTPGTEQVELNTYFDYNKEYLSYPLTNEPETLYFVVDSDTNPVRDPTAVGAANTPDQIAIGLTWEEQ